MAKKKEVAKDAALAFGVKSGNKTEKFQFVAPSFILKGVRYEVKDLFEGENLKAEHDGIVAELVKIQSGIIKKLD